MELSQYTREVLADVAEAKRVGGKRLWHFPADGRVKASDMKVAASQLLTFGIHGFRSGNSFHVSW